MTTLNSLDNIASGSASLAAWAMPILASKVLPAFSVAGKVRIAVMGGTGSGARCSGATGSATGSNSSPWGVKVLTVNSGDVLEFVIGAGGAAKTTDGAGNAGNSSLVKLNGVTIMTAKPGEPGAYGTTYPLNAPAPTATVLGADWVVPGLRAGAVPSVNNYTGGSAVDVFRTGLGRSFGAVGGSVGADAGPSPSPAFPSSSAELGVQFTGVEAAGSPGVGAPAGSGFYAPGIFAGGGGANSGTPQGGRLGGGGGGAYTVDSGPGGNGYAYIVFVPEA